MHRGDCREASRRRRLPRRIGARPFLDVAGSRGVSRRRLWLGVLRHLPLPADAQEERGKTPERDDLVQGGQDEGDAEVLGADRRTWPLDRPSASAPARALGGLDETSSEPPGRAARPDAASSVASVPFRYARSLRPCLGTSIAPRRRATFRQTLLGEVGENKQALERLEVGDFVLGGGPPRRPAGQGRGSCACSFAGLGTNKPAVSSGFVRLRG